jgi:hypothetical protein
MPKKDSKSGELKTTPDNRTDAVPVLKNSPIAQTSQVATIEALRHVFRRPSSPLCEY